MTYFCCVSFFHCKKHKYNNANKNDDPLLEKDCQYANVKFIPFAENMLNVKKYRLWSFDNSFEHHYPTVKKKKHPSRGLRSVGTTAWAKGAARQPANVLRRLHCPVAPAQHVLDSATSRLLSRRIKPWFFSACSARRRPVRLRKHHFKLRTGNPESYVRKHKIFVPFEIEMKVLDTYFYLFIFFPPPPHLSPHSSRFRFDQVSLDLGLEERGGKKRRRRRRKKLKSIS